MTSTLKLEIVTPEGIMYSDVVDLVTLQGADAQVTILPEHVRLMIQLAPGEMIASKSGHERFLALGEGLALVRGDRVSVMTDMAVTAENIDETRAEEARQRAAARLQEKISSEEIASVNGALARSLAQLRVKRHHRP